MRRRTPHSQQQNPYGSKIRKNYTATAYSATNIVTDRHYQHHPNEDLCHNGNVSVCKLLQDAVNDIFPEFDTDKRTSSTATTATTNNSTKDGTKLLEARLSSLSGAASDAQKDSFGAFLRSKIVHDSEEQDRQMKRLAEHAPATIFHSTEGREGRPEKGTTGATDTTNKKKQRKKKKKKNSNKNSSTTPPNEDGCVDGSTTAAKAATAVAATSTSADTDNLGAIPGHREYHGGKEVHPHDETMSLKGCSDDENSDRCLDETKKRDYVTNGEIGEIGRKGDAGSNDTRKKDKLEEMLNDRSHPMFLLPTDDDNKSVDNSIEALDSSVRRRGQILKLAEAKQQQIDFLDMIPNEGDTKNNNNDHPFSNGHITYGDDEELPSCSNVSYSMAADSSIYDERHVDGMSFDDDIDHDTADDFRRLISYFTSPLDVTVFIAPDREIFPIPTDISIDVRGDTERSSLEVPIMGISTLEGHDRNIDRGNDKIKILRALLDAYVHDHLLPEETAIDKNGENSSNIFSPKDMASFIDFCNQRSIQKREQAVGISFQELTDAINNIRCRNCKKSAMAEMQQLKRNIEDSIEDDCNSSSELSTLDTLVLDPSYFDQGTDEGAPLEEAFAYHQLEEGHHLPKHHRASLLSSNVNAALSNTKLSFVAIPSTNTKRKRAKGGGGESASNLSHIFFKPISSVQIDSFLTDWLPCGINESALFDDDGSSNHIQSELSTVDGRTQSEFDYYAKKAKEMYQTFTTHIEEMEAGRINLLNEWNSVVAAKADLPVLSQYTFAIKSDDAIKQHAAQILAVMSSFAEITHEFATLQLDIWTSYLGTLQKICKTTQIFYSRLEELADQNTGRINGYRKEVLQTNFDFMDSIITSLTDLSGTLHSTTKRIMKEWATRLTWQNSYGESGLMQLTNTDSSLLALVSSFSKWIAPVRKLNMEEKTTERSKTVTETVEIANGLLPELQDEFDSVRGHFTKEKSDFFHEFLDNADLYCKKWTVLGMTVQHESIFNMTAGLILIWRHVRIMQSWMTRSVNAPPMPLKLKKWMMEGDNDEEFASAFHNCGMGQWQLACTIAGLSYSWLKKRFDEWKAEKAEKELLIDFDTDVLSDSPKQSQKISSGKASKKKKKKKSKNTASSTTGTSAASERTETSAGENIGVSEDQSGVHLETYSDANADKVAAQGAATVEDRKALAQQGQEKATESEEAATKSESPEKADNVASESESELEILTGFESNVFIYDDDGMVTVEEFLSQRYDQVIESDEKLIIIY